MATKRILQNNRLLWLDTNINQKDPDIQHTLEQLQTIVYHVDLFTSIDDCLQFLNDQVKSEHGLILTSGFLGQHFVEKIHHLPQVDAIYILCRNPDRHRSWTSQWSKIKGIHNRIEPICDALCTAVKQTNENLTPISFVTRSDMDQVKGSTDDLNRLDPSFMYTTLFKRILLRMKHDPDEKKQIVKFCRAQYAGNPAELAIVDDFDRNYTSDKAIWWYTRECFTYQLLNRSLRLLESDIIVDMGFFIHDLHRQLEELYEEQFPRDMRATLTLYRGQALSIDDFDKLKKSCGGLLAFNGFLSTSTDKDVAMRFAQQASQSDNMVGIFFVMTVDPSIGSAIFANVKQRSFFQMENEVLFSMHTVFRIEDLIGLGEDKKLVEVRLTLSSDDDAALRRLTDRLDQETIGEEGWEQLGSVLMNVKQFAKAKELYIALLEQHPSEIYQALYSNQLGTIESHHGDAILAVKYYERAISIYEKSLLSNHPLLAATYSNIGGVYRTMEKYSEALFYHQKALSIFEKSLPANHPDLATSYNNIGGVYKSMGKYSQALLYLNKALSIYEKNLPVNHPDLATSYNNIGVVFDSMREYTQTLSYFKKALTIRERSLPSNHPSLLTSYDDIGALCKRMGEYSQALSYYNKALAIREKSLPENHSSLATSYDNIGEVYKSMGKYSQALPYYSKALAIREKSLPENHRDLPLSYNNIGWMYNNMEEYSKALPYYCKALIIYEKILPANHPDLATSYANISVTYFTLREYSQAYSFIQKAYDIQKCCLPPEHPETKMSEEWLSLIAKKLQK